MDSFDNLNCLQKRFFISIYSIWTQPLCDETVDNITDILLEIAADSPTQLRLLCDAVSSLFYVLCFPQDKRLLLDVIHELPILYQNMVRLSDITEYSNIRKAVLHAMESLNFFPTFNFPVPKTIHDFLAKQHFMTLKKIKVGK